MKFIVCLLAAVFSIVLSKPHVPWSHSHSSFIHEEPVFSHPSGYEAQANHNKAKYYAKKAHDLAKLRSSIYGVGHGFYGFRYGSHFPKHFSKPFPLLPFVTKYPIFDLGLHHYPFWFKSHHLLSPSTHYPSISEPLIGFGYPKTYHSSYSHSYGKGYSYGHGYSHGHKHSHQSGMPYGYGHSSLNLPYYPNYIKKDFPVETTIYKSEPKPHSHGYEYAYVKKTPEYSKFSPSHEGGGGYDSLYGLPYNDYGSVQSKFPIDGIAYESDIPSKSGDYVLIPSSDIALVGEAHEGDSYIPVQESSYGKLVDLTPDGDLHSLSLDSNPEVHKFDESDFVAYGSEKSETKRVKEK